MSKSQSVKIEEKEENDGHAFLSDDVANTLSIASSGPGIAAVCRGPTSAGAAVGIAGGLFPILKSGEAVQAGGARSAWRSVSGWFG